MQVTADIAREFAELGVRVKTIEAEDDLFDVWDINWPAMSVFMSMQTQWRTIALGTMDRARVILTGLDYAAVPHVMKVLGIRKKDRRDTWARLMILESAALKHEAEVTT